MSDSGRYVYDSLLVRHRMDTLGFEPRTFRSNDPLAICRTCRADSRPQRTDPDRTFCRTELCVPNRRE